MSKNHRFGSLPRDIQKTAAALGTTTVITLGDDGVHRYRQNRRERKLASPKRQSRLERKKLHIVKDEEHIETARHWMVSDLDQLSIITEDEWPKIFRRFASITEDAGVPFPTRKERQRENWERWHKALFEQLEYANDDQVLRYWAEANGILDETYCPICDLRAHEAKFGR